MESQLAAPATVARQTIGDRIREAREANGWSQQQLGDFVGVSRAAVSQWESGETKGLKAENLVMAAIKLRVRVEWLVFGTEPMVPIGGMGCHEAMDVKQIRKANLHRLIAEAGTTSELVRRTGTNPSYLSQIVGPNGKRDVGDHLARELEGKLGKPYGWMDHDHTNAVSPDEQDMLETYRRLPQADQALCREALKDRLSRARQAAGLTQAQLAKASGVTQQMISKLETGQSAETTGIVSLARALGKSPDWLESGIGQEDAPQLPNMVQFAVAITHASPRQIQQILDILGLNHQAVDAMITHRDNSGSINIGDRIRRERERRGWSQPRLARACGWESQSRISQYETGEREPKLADLEKVAKALDLTLVDLVAEQSPGRPSPSGRLR